MQTQTSAEKPKEIDLEGLEKRERLELAEKFIAKNRLFFIQINDALYQTGIERTCLDNPGLQQLIYRFFREAFYTVKQIFVNPIINQGNDIHNPFAIYPYFSDLIAAINNINSNPKSSTHVEALLELLDKAVNYPLTASEKNIIIAIKTAVEGERGPWFFYKPGPVELLINMSNKTYADNFYKMYESNDLEIQKIANKTSQRLIIESLAIIAAISCFVLGFFFPPLFVVSIFITCFIIAEKNNYPKNTEIKKNEARLPSSYQKISSAIGADTSSTPTCSPFLNNNEVDNNKVNSPNTGRSEKDSLKISETSNPHSFTY